MLKAKPLPTSRATWLRPGRFAARITDGHQAIVRSGSDTSVHDPTGWRNRVEAQRTLELKRGMDYPISRWLLRPVAFELACGLATSRVRPMHVTLTGLLLAAASILLLLQDHRASAWAACAVLGWWFCDRLDGQLARLQGRDSVFGAWLDANIDELVDLAMHAALALHWYQQSAGPWPAIACAAFFSGKYLTMYGLHTEAHWRAGCRETGRETGAVSSNSGHLAKLAPFSPVVSGPLRVVAQTTKRPSTNTRRLAAGWHARTIYHLLGNADVRAHALALALFCNGGPVELCLFAGYYHLRWCARYGLVWSRLRGLDG